MFKIFQWIWTTAAGQSIVGVNLKLVSIGLDVFRTLDLDVLRTLDLNYFSRIWVVFGRIGFNLFLIGSIGFGLSVYPKKEEVDRYWISWTWFFRIWINS